MGVLDRNNVHLSGSGRPMVFVHGFGCDQNMWRFLAPHFARSHRVVLLDLVGSGNSVLSAYDKGKYATLHGHAADI
jgi:sigma-B regulation protein RsbQ